MKFPQKLVFLALALFGCFQSKESFYIRKDLSGVFSLEVRFSQQSLLRYLEKVYPKKDLEAVCQAMEEEKSRQKLAKKIRKLLQKLPRGLSLKSFQFQAGHVFWKYKAVFSFDHLKDLKNLDLRHVAEEIDFPNLFHPFFNPFFPFSSFSLKQVSPSRLRLKIHFSPAIGEKSLSLEREALKMYETMQMTFSLTSEIPILKHNAHRKTENQLLWRFSLSSLKKYHRQGVSPYLLVEWEFRRSKQ